MAAQLVRFNQAVDLSRAHLSPIVGAGIQPSLHSQLSSFLQLGHQPSSRATRIKPTSATVAQSCFTNNLIRCKGYLLSNEKYQSGNENCTLSEAIPRQRIKQYMQERHKWDKETFDKVNLDAYAAARRSNQRLERFSSRFAHGWLPTRTRMRIIGTAGNDECIWCHDTETQDHLFQCPHQSAWRAEFIERLDKYLTDSATEPTVKEVECTTSWLNQSTCPCKCDQLRIGRHLLIRGYVANECYYRDQQKPAKLSLNGRRT
jgi:hypothetical protein